jgi:hypothetical protein
MILEVPLRSDISQYNFLFDVLNQTFRFDFDWNVRESRWYFSVYTSEDVPIILGQPILANYDMLGRFRLSQFADFDLIFVDTSGQFLDPGRFDLGSRVLAYIDLGG